MGKIKDLTGMRFGKLLVISFYGFKTKPSGERNALWLCECDCGNEKVINRNELTSGRTKSCGCLKPKTTTNRVKRETPYNTYDLSGDYGIGYDSKGNKFYFDLEDYDRIKDHYWALREDGYISTIIKKSWVPLHRFVFDMYDKDFLIDHINHNTYDNRKIEMRIVNSSENNMNRRKRSDNTSGVVGVCWNKNKGKWMSYICAYGKRKTLGCFDDFKNAVKVRRDAEKEYFGEYAYNWEDKL